MSTIAVLAGLGVAVLLQGLPTRDPVRLVALARIARAQQERARATTTRPPETANPTRIRESDAAPKPVYDYARAHRAALQAREALLDPLARTNLTHQAFIAFKVETDYALYLAATSEARALAAAYGRAALAVDVARTLARRGADAIRLQSAILAALEAIDKANAEYLGMRK